MAQILVTAAVNKSVTAIINQIKNEIVPAVNAKAASQKNLKAQVSLALSSKAKSDLEKELRLAAKAVKTDGLKLEGSLSIDKTKDQIKKDLQSIKKSYKGFKIGLIGTLNVSETRKEIRNVLQTNIAPEINKTLKNKISLLVDIDEANSIKTIQSKLQKVITDVSNGTYTITLKEIFGENQQKNVVESLDKLKNQVSAQLNKISGSDINKIKSVFSDDFIANNETAINNLETTFNSYLNVIESIKAESPKFDVADKSTWSELTEEQLKSLLQVTQELNIQFTRLQSSARQNGGLQSQAAGFETMRTRAKALLDEYKDYLNKTPEIIAATKKLQEIMNSPTSTPAQIKEARSALEGLILQFKQGEGAVERFKRTFSEKLFYGITAAAAMLVRQGLRKVYQAVKDIDDAMVELKRVTNETSDTYDKVLDSAIAKAKELGTNVATVTNAIADFARLGYSVDEATKLAEVATVYTNVGDDVNDMSQATESIISTMKAFGIEAENAMEIVDKFNDVGNNFAISAGGIGDALQRSAASLSFAGNSVEQAIGLVVGANDVVQNAETVGKMYADYKNNYIG